MRLSAVLLTIAIPLLAQNTQQNTDLPLAFPDIPTLRHWSDMTNLGPASIDLVNYQGKEVAIVRRSFGSGLPACALSIFSKSTNGWQESLKLALARDHWFEFVQNGDSILIRDQTNKFEILRFSISNLASLYP